MTKPLVSIIICTYNRADFIIKALDSALNQSYQNKEIVVIDDASKDNTSQILEKYQDKHGEIIKYRVNETNLGISKNRNTAVSIANGKYIAMLDSDDYWIDSEKLEKQTQILEKDPSLGLVGSAIKCINENGQRIKDDIYHTRDQQIRNHILAKNQFAQSSVVFPKTVFDKIGGYREDMNVCEDLDLWLRIGTKYRLSNIPDITTAYTIHAKGISKQRRREIAREVDNIIECNRKNYPNYWIAKIKSIIRLTMSWLD